MISRASPEMAVFLKDRPEICEQYDKATKRIVEASVELEPLTREGRPIDFLVGRAVDRLVNEEPE